MPIRFPSLGRPAKGLVALRDIGAGLNLKASRYAVPPNMATRLQNVYLVEDGSLMGRRGTSRWNASPLGSGMILGATRAYFAGSNHWLVNMAGTIYKGDDASKTFSASLSGWNSEALTWFVQYLGYVYASNGIDPPKKWDGSTWSDMGIAAPTSTLTPSEGVAGDLTGTYRFKVTFETATIESNPSDASVEITVSGKRIDFSNIPLGPAGTIRRRIYGFKVNVSSDYQRALTIDDNVTTSYSGFDVDQDAWTIEPPTDHDPPPTSGWLTVLFKHRLWKASGVRLWFSQIFLPEAWPPDFWVDVPFDLGDQITALFVLGDVLLIFSDNAIFYLVGDTPFSFVLKRSFAQAGCPSPWAIDRVENAVVFLSRFGLYAFDAAQTRPLSDLIEPQFTGIFPDYRLVNYGAARTATLVYYDKLKAVVVSFPTVSTPNDTTYWYFLRRSGYAQDTRAARQFIVAKGRGDDGSLYAWDPNDGILRQWDTGYTDDGSPITMVYRTPMLSGENPLGDNVWGYVTLRARPTSSAVSVTVFAAIDEGSVTDTFALPLQVGASRYGEAVYGTAVYAGDLVEIEERFSPEMRGRNIQLTLTVQYQEMVHLYQLYVSHDPKPVRRKVT